ncbi:MAG: helix-turn-helix domain-containing protein [Defluviimonas sp.]|nr:helix-turn-helix domain-containing protein [Defluviimonas sp.]
MSNLHITHVMNHGPRCRAERLVMLALADRADEHGFCHPAMIDIANRAAMTERGARGVIRRLEASGWLEVKRGGGRHGTSRYRVLLRPAQAEETRNGDPGINQLEGEKPGTGLHNTRNHRSAEPPRTPIKDEAKASPPQAAPGADQPSLWKDGLRFLIANGVAEKNARSNLGRWRRDYPEPMILAVMSEAERQEVTEPVAWINGALKRRAQNVITLKREGTSDGTDRIRDIFGAAHPSHRAAPGQAARMLDAARRLGFFDQES